MRDPSVESCLYLRPGEWFSGQEGVLVKTILGSCIAVTMFHRKLRLAAICHALMPLCEKKKGCTGLCMNFSRYADCIIRRMAGVFFERGFKAGDVEVKLFGGADSLSNASGTKGPLGVGTRNVEQARKTLEEEGFRLARSDVGGSTGRKLLFNTATGEVLLRRLDRAVDTGTRRFLAVQFAGTTVNRGKTG